jgi:DNA-binding Xre family transcriptional regulator
MESVARKINIALAKNDMKRIDLAKKIGMIDTNFYQLLKKDRYKTDVLENIANAMGYDLEISFIDRETGERI